MPIDVLFIHSAGTQRGDAGSTPFVKQLRRDLGAAYRVTCPTMPLPDQPSYARWRGELARRLGRGRWPPLLVGHSLGGSVLLKYLSEEATRVPASGLFLVATPFWGDQDWDVDEFVLPDGFAQTLPDTLQVHLYQARDDEVVSFAHLSRYAEAMPQARVHALDGGGHTFRDGLPALVRDIRAVPVAVTAARARTAGA